jgi:hypothetical protein
MLEVKTLLNKMHRPARPTAEGFTANPGQWAYISSSGLLTNIATDSETQHQPAVLKMVINVATSETYEGHETRAARRAATLEGIFRAAVDSTGFQVYDTQAVPVAITYTQGAYLTPAYRITSAGTSDTHYSAPADIGKLRPAGVGDLIVARVEQFDGATLEFMTVSPKPYGGGDDVWEAKGSGALLDQKPILFGDARMFTPSGSGDISVILPVVDGAGDNVGP